MFLLFLNFWVHFFLNEKKPEIGGVRWNTDKNFFFLFIYLNFNLIGD